MKVIYAVLTFVLFQCSLLASQPMDVSHGPGESRPTLRAVLATRCLNIESMLKVAQVALGPEKILVRSSKIEMAGYHEVTLLLENFPGGKNGEFFKFQVASDILRQNILNQKIYNFPHPDYLSLNVLDYNLRGDTFEQGLDLAYRGDHPKISLECTDFPWPERGFKINFRVSGYTDPDDDEIGLSWSFMSYDNTSTISGYTPQLMPRSTLTVWEDEEDSGVGKLSDILFYRLN